MMKKHVLYVLLCFLSIVNLQAQNSLQHLKVEYQSEPIGLDEQHPRFSWQMKSSDKSRGNQQQAYRIVVRDAKNQVAWDSKKVNSPLSLGINYEGLALQASQKYQWNVQVWDQQNKVSSASSWFETGLLNSSAQAWNGAEWIGENDLPLYSHYLSMYKIQFGIQLDEASKSTKASFVFGANDPRLQNRNLNIMDVANGPNASYIQLEFDINNVAESDSGLAQLNVYRVGYDKKDSPSKVFASFKIAKSLISPANKYQKHTIFAQCNFGVFDFYLDQVDPAHKINGAPAGAAAAPRGGQSGLNLNPVGRGNNFISFPMLSEIGFQVPANQKALFSGVLIKNFRFPSNTLFDAAENPSLFSHNSIQWDGKQFQITASSGNVLFCANPSRFAAPMLRTQFASVPNKTIKQARIYSTARGIYELYLNGERVGKDFFNPGLTQYNKTHLYQTFDVTKQIKSGENAWGAWLSEGWWSGNITFSGDSWNFFGDRQSLLAKLVIQYTDGTEQIITTNPEKWTYSNDGPIRYGSFFQGEVYDARKEAAIAGWSTATFQAKGWKPAAKIPLEGTAYVGDVPNALNYAGMHLVGQLDDAVQVRKVMQAKSMHEPRKGVYVYDMGQNMVGFPKIFIPNGKAGQTITLRFAEVLYPDLAEYASQKGMIMLENIRAALAQDVYILKGGDEYIQPRFTFHGYRYLEITGLDQAPALSQVAGLVLSSIQDIGSYYESSDPLVNKLWNNITWSMRGNFLSIPTDTPARNERMGWSGDINVFSKTATYMAPVNNFMRRHLLAMRDVQRADGRFTDVAPMGGGFGGTLWGSAGIIIPWETYQQYGDKNMLIEHYDAMKRYVAFLETKVDPANGIVNEGPLGDWLSPENNKNDNTLFWMTYQSYNLKIMSQVAGILGNKSDESSYLAQYENKKKVINSVYIDPNTHRTVKSGVRAARMGPPGAAPAAPATPPVSDKGQLMDTQASYAIPLALGVIDDNNKPFIVKHLVETVQRSNKDDEGVARPPYSLMTGFIGTASIADALSNNQQHDVAYGLLTQKTYPSWLYSVANGATTIWERLNSYTIENGFGGNNSMNSFNHYSFGAIAAWMYQTSLGIQRDVASPGFKHFSLQPTPDLSGKINFAKGYVETMYGKVSSEWKKEGNVMSYKFTVPANTTAHLKLPASSAKVTEGSQDVTKSKGISGLKQEGNFLEMELNSGSYEFKVSPLK
ncbi:family 78 glycoside hydrolase catalytic domain [Aquirufa nivalisilvae]